MRFLSLFFACLLVFPFILVQSSSAQPNVVVNPGFESGEPIANLPDGYGFWSGDEVGYVSAENGINPVGGSRMLRFIYAAQTWPGSMGSSELWQVIDISNFPDLTNVEVTFSAWFNRVLGDAQTDTWFYVGIYACAGSPSSFPSQLSAGTYLKVVSGGVNTDGIVDTWEQAATTLVVPEGTDFLGVVVAANENIHNDWIDPEFDGHYADDVVLFIPAEQGDFWYSVFGRLSVRAGFDTEFYLHYGNAGNATIDKATVLLTTTSNATMSHDVPLAWSISETYEESPSDSVLFLAYNLTPGTWGTVPFDLKAWSGPEVTLSSTAWIIPPIYPDSSLVPGSATMVQASEGELHSFSELNQRSFTYTYPDPPDDGSIVFQSCLGAGHMGIVWYDNENLIDGGVYVWENLDDGSGGTRLTSWEHFCWRTENTPMGWQGSYSPPLTGPELTNLRNTIWANSQYGTPLPFIYFIYMCNDAVHDIFKHATGRNLIDGHIHQTWDFPAYDWWKLKGEFWEVWPENVWVLPRIVIEEAINTLLEEAVTVLEKSPFVISVVNSWDPNEKIGFSGYGPERYISGDQELPYLIYFENHPDSASASARLVTIIDTLDVSKFDMSSFELGPIIVGDSSIAPPSTARSWTSVLDLPDTINVGISIDVDTVTGIVTWEFETLDSLTGLPPEDQLVGFLPINTNPPEGEGHVGFSILTWDSLSTGTDIENRASIVFDFNEAILTEPWENKVDNTPPQSHVCTLDSIENSQSFEVEWEGFDEGAGGLVYSIYVSDNNSPFEPWIVETSDTVAWYTGQASHTYAFYSIAKDGAGNTEPFPVTSDMQTIVSATATGIQIPKHAEWGLHQNYPNPFNPKTTIKYSIKERSHVSVKIYNVLGQLVKTLVNEEKIPGVYVKQWDSRNNAGNPVASGVYFYRLVAKDFVQTKKLVVLK
jgi:hypothetical protein